MATITISSSLASSLLPLLCLLLVAAANQQPQEHPTPASPPVTLPGCPDKCGNVSIPYPFGTQEGCFRPGFFVVCNHTFDPPRPFINSSLSTDKTYAPIYIRILVEDLYYMFSSDGKLEEETTPIKTAWPVELAGVSLSEGKARLLGAFSYECWVNKTQHSVRRQSIHLGLDSPFRLSDADNVLMGIGSYTVAEQTFGPFCQSYVSSSKGAVSGPCTGQGCCQTNLPPFLPGTMADIQKDPKLYKIYQFIRCSYAMIVEKTWYNFSSADLKSDAFLRRNGVSKGVIPFVVNFTIDTGTCPEAGKPKPKDFACISDHSECVDRQVEDNGTRHYYCRCSDGYEGNPYIDGGCQDINECDRQDLYPCHGKERKCQEITNVAVELEREEMQNKRRALTCFLFLPRYL